MARKPDAGEGKTISKAFAYRAAEKELGREADLESVQKLLKDKFGIDMKKPQISQYRANEKKRRRKRGGRPKGSKNAAAVAPPVGSDDRVLEFVSTVRGWENKLGADRICQVIDALYKTK